jgi:hypothetical protein
MAHETKRGSLTYLDFPAVGRDLRDCPLTLLREYWHQFSPRGANSLMVVFFVSAADFS